MIPLIRLGNIEISTYWMMMGLGYLAMVFLVLKRRERFNLKKWQSIAITSAIMFFGILGSKLLYCLENMNELQGNGLPLTNGFSFFGAVFLIPPLMACFGMLFGLRPKQTMDLSAPCGVLMAGTLRFGCFMNGCCGGISAVLFGHTFRWPTQAIESIGDFAILFWLLSVEKKNSEEAHLYPRFMLTYGVLRFFVELMRDTPKDWWALSHGQWFSIIAVAVSATILTRKNALGKRNAQCNGRKK